jgi:Ras-related GTP-binding protein C/D
METSPRTSASQSKSPAVSQKDFDQNLARLDDTASSTLIRFFQNLEDAEAPASPITPKYHTGKLPNSKVADGKPRLLLMGQRR